MPVVFRNWGRDFFINYAKSDHALALKWSTFLEIEGWSVWWNKILYVADHYGDEIMSNSRQQREQ